MVVQRHPTNTDKTVQRSTFDRLLGVNPDWDRFVYIEFFSTEPSPVTIHSVGRKAAEEVSTPIRLFEFILLNTFKTVSGQRYHTGCQTDWCCPWTTFQYLKIRLKSDPCSGESSDRNLHHEPPNRSINGPGISGSNPVNRFIFSWGLLIEP